MADWPLVDLQNSFFLLLLSEYFKIHILYLLTMGIRSVRGTNEIVHVGTMEKQESITSSFTFSLCIVGYLGLDYVWPWHWPINSVAIRCIFRFLKLYEIAVFQIFP